MSFRVCVVGRGKVGRALQRALRAAGVESTLRGRTGATDADVVLLAVPDARIAEAARALQVRANSVVLHLAGARDQRELLGLQAQGAHVGVLHPLLSFASPGHAPSFAGATFTCFGDVRAIRAARRVARQLGARAVVLNQPPGPAYHAAAALVANGATALVQLGVQALVATGFARPEAERALASLLSSVAQNVAQLGVPSALTGPVSRGDAGTVRAHLAALQYIDRELAQGYAALLPAIVATARAQGLEPRLARAIERAARARGKP